MTSMYCMLNLHIFNVPCTDLASMNKACAKNSPDCVSSNEELS